MTDFVIPEKELRNQALADGITHVSTGVAIVKNGKVLAVRRAANDFLGGNFELPGGGVDPGETFLESVKREVFEETDLTVQRILGMFPGIEYATPNKPNVRQLNFLVESDGADVVLSKEHDRWQWVDLGDLDKLTMTKSMKTCFKHALNKTNQVENDSR